MSEHDKNFVDTPQHSEFVRMPAGYKGGSGTYNGEDTPPFSEHRRTPSPDAVPELTYDKAISGGKPSGEPDQF